MLLSMSLALLAAGGTALAQTNTTNRPALDPAWMDMEWLAHLTWRADQLEKDGNGPGLEAVCREALRLAPAYDGALERMARQYERNQEHELALMTRLYRASFNTNLSSTVVNDWVVKAEEFRAKARPPSTEEELLQRNKDLDELAGAVADDLRQGRLGDCEMKLRGALLKRPSDPKLLLDLGSVYIRSREWAACLMVFSYAHRLFPGNADFANNLASALARLDRHEEALSLLENQLKGDPESPFLLENAGMQASRLKQARRALMHFSKWIEVDPTNPSAWTKYGAALVEAGPDKLVFAKVAFRKVLDMDPGNVLALYYLAGLEALRGNEKACAEALAELSKTWGGERVEALLTEDPFRKLKGLSARLGRTGTSPERISP